MPPLTPALVLTSIWGVYAFLNLVLGGAIRGHRVSLWLAAVFAASAAGAAWVNAFWPMVILGLLALTATFAAVQAVDLSWRMRAALNASVVVLGFLALWPTFNHMSAGRFPCPAYIKEHVSFRLVAGLD